MNNSAYRFNESKTSKHRRAFENEDKGGKLDAMEFADKRAMVIVKTWSVRLDSPQGCLLEIPLPICGHKIYSKTGHF